MTPDRIVYSFVLGWVVLISVLILLDWLGNPDRGGFRPKGERPARSFRTRQRVRRRRRLEEDAAVRATLRDAYGASSLRLTWTRELEDAVREADDSLVVPEGTSIEDLLEVDSEEVVRPDYTAAVGDPLPNLDEAATAEPAAPAPAGWRVGVDPLAPTRTGARPSAQTIRARTWKNHADAAWSADNRSRVRAGKAARRRNPVTGRDETARVDVERGIAEWPDQPIDPFETGT